MNIHKLFTPNGLTLAPLYSFQGLGEDVRYEVGPIVRPKCGGTMKVVAFISGYAGFPQGFSCPVVLGSQSRDLDPFAYRTITFFYRSGSLGKMQELIVVQVGCFLEILWPGRIS